MMEPAWRAVQAAQTDINAAFGTPPAENQQIVAHLRDAISNLEAAIDLIEGEESQ